MTIPSIDLTQAEPFELIQLKARIATEQARRDQLTQARTILNTAMAGFLCAGGCRDTLIAELQNTPDPAPAPDPAPDPDPDPGGEGETPAPTEGETPAPTEDDTPPDAGGAGAPTD